MYTQAHRKTWILCGVWVRGWPWQFHPDLKAQDGSTSQAPSAACPCGHVSVLVFIPACHASVTGSPHVCVSPHLSLRLCICHCAPLQATEAKTQLPVRFSEFFLSPRALGVMGLREGWAKFWLRSGIRKPQSWKRPWKCLGLSTSFRK